MDINQFWSIIDQVKHVEAPEDALPQHLKPLSPEEIIAFQKHFDALFDAAYRWDIWGAAYLINGGCSDDGFMDFRYALISMGKDVYEKTLENPDSLVSILDLKGESEIENESFAYIASEVYEEKTGEASIPRALRDFDEIEENMGEEWDFDDDEENKKRLPKLFAFVEENDWSE